MSDNSTYTQDEQQAPTPNPDLKSLERLIGTWKVFDPSGSGAIEGQVTYAWVEGGFFLTQHVEFVQGGRTIKGLEIIGHEQTFGQEPSEEIKSRYYDYFSGQTLDYVYELEATPSRSGAGQKALQRTSGGSSAKTATALPAAGCTREAAGTSRP